MSRHAETEGYITLTSSSEEWSGSPSPPPAKRPRTAAAAARTAVAPSRRQPPRRGLAASIADATAEAEPASGPAAAVGLRRSTRQAAGQEQRAGQAAALTHLRQARAAATLQHGMPRRRRPAAAVIQDSEEEEPEEAEAKQACDGGTSDSQTPAGRSHAARRRRGGRAQIKYLTGARDYVPSESDDDLDDFIAADDEDGGTASSSGGQGSTGGSGASSGGSESEPGEAAARVAAARRSEQEGRRDATPGARGRAAAAAARGLAGGFAGVAAAAGWEEDDEEEGGSAPGTAAAGSGSSSEGSGLGSGRRRRTRRAAAVVASSESEEEVLAGVQPARGAATPGLKRRRLQRPGAEEPTPGSSGQRERCEPRPEEGGAAQGTPGSADQAPRPAGTPGGSAQWPRRQLPTRPALNAADRIRQAQQRWQLAPGMGSAAGDGEEEEDGEEGPLQELPGTDDEVSWLTDEGDPDALPSDEEGQRGSQDGCAEEVTGRRQGRPARGGSGGAEGGATSPGWQRAAEVLGVGAYTAEQLFAIYVEYQLLCYVDPGYAETVRRSPRHDDYYQRAIRSVEFEMTRLRGSVASDAWKNSTSGLLQALECLPGIETGWTDEDGAQELAGMPCDACNRSRSHATRQLILKGVPYQPLWGDAALISNRRLSDQFAQTSPVFQKRQRLQWMEGEPRQEERGSGSSARPSSRPAAAEQSNDAARRGRRREAFHVGRFCCARLSLFHALFHWRRRLLARLKRELKAELRRRKRGGFPCDRSAVADALLGRQSLMAQLHANYRRLLALAERYALSGGEGSRRGWKTEFEGMHAEVTAAQAELHGDSEAEEPSVTWPEEACADGGEADSTSEEGSSSSSSGHEEEQEGEQGQAGSAQQQLQQVEQQPAAAAADPGGRVAGSRRGPQAAAVAEPQQAWQHPLAAQRAQQQTPPSQQKLRQVDIRNFFRRHQPGPQ